MPKEIYLGSLSSHIMNCNNICVDQIIIHNNTEGKENWPQDIDPWTMNQPFIITSCKRVDNLNVQYLNGKEANSFLQLYNNNLGIGISKPIEKLEINGAINIGNSISEKNGTIRWTGQDFEGRKSGNWISLTEKNNLTEQNILTKEQKNLLLKATWHSISGTIIRRDSNGNIASNIIKSSLLGLVLEPNQPNIKSVGILNNLEVENIKINNNTIHIGDKHQISIIGGKFKFITNYTEQGKNGELIGKYEELDINSWSNKNNNVTTLEYCNVGIGIVNPLEKLHINGGILIGSSNSVINGTIRWTGQDFEGRISNNWVSLTGTGNNITNSNMTIKQSDNNIVAQNINTCIFDTNSGFEVIHKKKNIAKIKINSIWRKIEVPGQNPLTPKNTDKLCIIGGPGISIKTNILTEPYSLIISSTIPNVQLLEGKTTDKKTLLGKNAGLHTTGINNVIIGTNSGYSNTLGSENTFLGKSSGFSNTTSTLNTFIGCLSGYSNTISQQCTYIGSWAGQYSDGHYNTFIGAGAGQYITKGERNVCIGMKSGRGNSKTNATGFRNTFIGAYNGFNLTTGSENIMIGYGSGYLLTEGNSNIFLGTNVGYNIISGSKNIMIGHNSGHYLGNVSNKLIIANGQTKNDVLIEGDLLEKNLCIFGNCNINGILKINNVDIITNLQTQNKRLENEIINITEKFNKLEKLIQNLLN